MQLKNQIGDGFRLRQMSSNFNRELEAIKLEIDPLFPWYPYGTLNNFIHLERVFDDYPLATLIGGGLKTLDIGGADGDLAFFLESLRFKPDIIDYAPTNYNHLKGAKLVRAKLNSNVKIYERDLDSQFTGLTEKYGLIFLLGILYHLKNPYYVLETLSGISDHLVVSTRVAKYSRDGIRIEALPVAYLLAPDEANNDPTNYWIFSYKGLEQIFQRTGWKIIKMFSVGDTYLSNPSDPDHDERVFALLKSKQF